MGKARILVDAAPGRPERQWCSSREIPPYSTMKKSSGESRAKALAKLTGATINIFSGVKAYTAVERSAFFNESHALSMEQIETGDFEVLVLEWPDRVAKKHSGSSKRIVMEAGQ